MKKLTTSAKAFLFPAAMMMLVASSELEAQDASFKDVSFEYIQLPLKPIRKDITNYQAKVILKYIDDVNASKGSYQERVKMAEDAYAKDMENYYIQTKLADDQYNREMDEWNKKSLAEKLVLEKNKPQKKYIPMPYKQMPVEEKYQKTFDTELLAGKYFKLEGFNNNPANAATVTVKLLGFDSQAPELNQKEYTKTVNNQSQKYYKYSYSIKYKHPVGYRIETPAEGLVYEDFPVEMTNYSVAATAEYDDKYKLDDWWNTAKDGYLNNLQEQVVNRNLDALGKTINNMFGYKKISYATEIGSVDERKNYDDLKDAYAAAISGYNALITDQTKTEAKSNLQKAADIWEKCMKESNPDKKKNKARINRDITKMVMVNLMEVYIWLDEYDKSQAYFDKLMAIDPDNKNKHRAERLRAFARDAKERFIANR